MGFNSVFKRLNKLILGIGVGTLYEVSFTSCVLFYFN